MKDFYVKLDFDYILKNMFFYPFQLSCQDYGCPQISNFLIVSCRQLEVVQNRKYAFHMLIAHWQLFLGGQLEVKRLRPAQ